MVKDIRKQFFPMKLPSGVTAHSMDRNAAQEEIERFNDRIFPPRFKEESGAFRPPKERAEKVARLWSQRIDTHPEWVVFFDQSGNPIGWFYGYMEDEETFFIDTIGLVPEFRKKGVYQAFLQQLITYLKAVGYERLTSSHHPNNRAVLIPETRLTGHLGSPPGTNLPGGPSLGRGDGPVSIGVETIQEALRPPGTIFTARSGGSTFGIPPPAPHLPRGPRTT